MFQDDLRKRGWPVYVFDGVKKAREVLQILRHVVTGSPIVLTDVSKLGKKQGLIYPLLDQSAQEWVLLASRDNISGGLRSRCKRVVVDPYVDRNVPDDPGAVRARLEAGEDLSPEFLAFQCPSVAPLMYKLERVDLPAKGRILDLFVTGLVGGS